MISMREHGIRSISLISTNALDMELVNEAVDSTDVGLKIELRNSTSSVGQCYAVRRSWCCSIGGVNRIAGPLRTLTNL